MTSLLERLHQSNFIPIILGPSCPSIGYIGFIIDSFNLLSVADFSPNPYQFQSVFRFTSAYRSVYYAVPNFLKSQGWNSVYLLSEAFDYWTSPEETLAERLASANISLAGVVKVAGIQGSPDPKFYDKAAVELAQQNPRVVFILSSVSTFTACSLYKAGLYGSNMVFIFTGISMFYPNNPIRSPNCTNHMLAEVLRSVIILKPAAPIDVDPKFEDEIGMSGSEYDFLLKTAINDENAQVQRSWFNWRSSFYSEAVGVALVVDEIEKKLQVQNDSILNWMTNGENFNSHGRFIRDLFHEEFTNFHYKGLNTFENHSINANNGLTAIYQIQQGDPTSDESISFTPVPVAIHNGFSNDYKTLNALKWRTHDKQPPKDSVITIKREIRVLPLAFTISTIIVSILSMVVTFTTVKILINKDQSGLMFDLKIKKFSVAIGFGIFLISLAIISLSLIDFIKPHSISCMISTPLLILGIWIVDICVLAKFVIAKLINSGTMSQTNLRISRKFEILQQLKSVHLSSLVSVKVKFWWKCLLVVPTLFTFVATIWLLINPLVDETIYQGHKQSFDDPDTFYDDFAITCSSSGKSWIAFLLFFGLPFFFVQIDLIRHGFLTSKVSPTKIREISTLRSSTYATSSIILIGVAMMLLIYSNQPIPLLIALIVLLLVVLIALVIYHVVFVVVH